ncbi:MAG: acyl carrier protein [Solirubrobacteraceae bacterium]
MHDRVRELVADVFALDVQDVPADASAETFPEAWDSLRHLELMLELELAFGVRIPTDTIPELVSIPAIVDFLGATAPNA